MLYELEGWSLAELSVMTGRTGGSLKTRLSRLRTKMRRGTDSVSKRLRRGTNGNWKGNGMHCHQARERLTALRGQVPEGGR